MAEENKTWILGVQFFDAPFEYRLPIYWDESKGNLGYHSIRWEQTDAEFTVKSRTYVWGTVHEAQAGLVLNELINRSPTNWFWAKESVPLFPGSHGFHMKKDLAERLKNWSQEDLFSGIKVCQELYDRDVMVGFGTIDIIESRRTKWYPLLQNSADIVLREYLKDGVNEAEAKKVTNELMYLSTTESQAEQAKLRYLMTHKPNLGDRILDIACDSIGPIYEMYDKKAGTGLVKRTDDHKRIIIPPDKIFANPQNVRRGIQELKINILKK